MDPFREQIEGLREEIAAAFALTGEEVARAHEVTRGGFPSMYEAPGVLPWLVGCAALVTLDQLLAGSEVPEEALDDLQMRLEQSTVVLLRDGSLRVLLSGEDEPVAFTEVQRQALERFAKYCSLFPPLGSDGYQWRVVCERLAGICRAGAIFKLFEYNWQVRREWFEWCRAVSESELLAPRTGGRGGILATLFHVVDVEYSWIRILQQEPDFSEPFEDFASLEKVEALSERLHAEVLAFFDDWQSEQENCTLELPDDDGTMVTFTHGEILRHAAAHEIHHMGQLSVWAREMGIKPVNANLIGRGIQ